MDGQLIVNLTKKIAVLEREIVDLKETVDRFKKLADQSEICTGETTTSGASKQLLERALMKRGEMFDGEEEPFIEAVVRPWCVSKSLLTQRFRAGEHPHAIWPFRAQASAATTATGTIQISLFGDAHPHVSIASASQSACNSSATAGLMSTPQRTLSQREVEEKSKALYEAAREGHEDEVRRLLEEGALITYADCFRETPLHKAAERGHYGIVSALISAGALPSVADNGGSTALHRAAERGHSDVVSALITVGAPLDARSYTLRTPIHWAAVNGHRECTEMLLRAGADPNAKDKDGDTPLHVAARFNRGQCVGLLLREGANPSLKNNRGNIPKDDASTSAVRALFR